MRLEIDDSTRMIKNLVRSFALVDKPTKDFVSEINDERNGLHERESQLEVQLAEVEEEDRQAPNSDLLDALPVGEVRIEELPEDVARRLLEALRLELRYCKDANRIKYTVTLLGPTVPAARQASHEAVILPFNREKRLGERKRNNKNEEDVMSDISPDPIISVPSAGFEPATPASGGQCSIP